MRSRDRLVIAIDGPAGAGKSTIAKMLAERLGLRYVSTGLMYRAVTLKAIESAVDPDDIGSITRLARSCDITFVWTDPATARVYLDGRDVTSRLASPEVDAMVSPVSRVPEVREILTEKQRLLARDGGVVMEGRDIGTVVLPGADLKIFLTASADERALRRAKQMEENGVKVNLTAVKQNIEARDDMDSRRSVAPLRRAPDAVVIDSTGKTPGEVLSEILRLLDA
ncbi:MAG TPA: (d)CMP kinase [Firmicutes bacterium]|nr:(d)CMP kinase [Bacillota bacterium]